MDHPFQPTVIELNQRETPAWFDEEKLGIFIHWGPYAVPGRGEWYRFNMVYNAGIREYHNATYGEDFPYSNFGPMWKEAIEEGDTWDPAAWADLFRASGAKYVVLTAKHHDGFLLWPSETPNPLVAGWQLERDVVGELAEAVRAQGLRFGAYYSGGLDWNFRFPSGPGPIRQLQSHLNNEEEGWYTENHYRELIDRYRPSLLWNDISYPTGAGFEFKWGMIADYYAAVPDGMINDRFLDSSFIQRPLDRNPWLYDLLDWLLGYGPGGSVSAANLQQHSWDRKATGSVLHGPAITDLWDLINAYYPPHFGYMTMEFSEFDQIESKKWERCKTLGTSWGYNRFETEENMLTGEELIHLFVDIVSKNGNLLINVGPTAEGIIPDIQQAPLLALGRWLDVNGEAIYNTRPWNRSEGVTGSGQAVRFTHNQTDQKVYAIVLGGLSGESVLLTDFAPDPVQIELLGAGPCPGWSQGEDGLLIELPASLPDQEAYVFSITRFVQEFLPPLPPAKIWELAWQDEFSGEILDETKWSHVCENCQRKGGYWTSDAAYLDGHGSLVVETYEEGGLYYDGAIRTKDKFEHAFGYYEARIKLHSECGHWPAFWLMTGRVGSIGDGGRDGAEIDIMEKPWATGLTKCFTNHALHWDGYGPEGQSAERVSITPGIMDGYHTYGLWWSPDEYVFYIDGREVWRTAAGGVSQEPGYIKLTDEVGDGWVFMCPIENAQLPDFWYVDYVRVFDLVDDSY